MLYVILSPTGPYFPSGIKPISILSSVDCLTPLTSLNPDGDKPARSWPGGTGEYKLGVNYLPAFEPQREAAKRGYEQVLWVLDEQTGLSASGKKCERRVTELGQMNFFCVVRRDDGGNHLRSF
jgi:branched-chain amino acid aminotransferase